MNDLSNLTSRMLLVAVAAFAVAYTPASAAARIKCWTNDEGVRECGNVVPPKYSQKGHQTVNRQGVVISRAKRAKTQEELEAEAKTNEKARLEAEEEARLAKERDARDRVLLDTFTTEEDLVLAHQGRLAAIDSRVTHTRQIVDGLKTDLSKLEADAANQERAGKALSDELNNKISDTQRRISEQLDFIAKRHQEKSELDQQFDKDLTRYRELKGTR